MARIFYLKILCFLGTCLTSGVALALTPTDWNDCTGPRTPRSIAACGKVLSDQVLTPDRRATALKARGQAHAAQGDHDRALTDFDEAARLAPRDADILNGRALSRRAKGDLWHGVQDLDAAIRLNPGMAVFYANRGSMLAADRQAERAIADFDQAIRLEPTNSSHYLNRANVLITVGLPPRAIADLDRVLQLQPKSAAALHLRAQANLAQKLPDPAISDLDTALTLTPRDAYLFATRGRAYVQKGRADRALADFSEAIRLRPDMGTAYVNRAEALEKSGNTVRAIADYTEAARLDPRDAAARSALARLTAKPVQVAKAPQPEPQVISKASAAPDPAVAPVSGRRVALVIGNGAYRHEASLRNPAADARAVTEALGRIGFDVTTVLDADRQGFSNSLKEFSDKADRAAIALVYYSGHGVQIARGAVTENYLLPVDAQMKTARDAEDEAFPLSRVLDRASGAQVRVAILDACRDNPFSRQMVGATRGGGSKGLARADMADHGALVVYATQPNNVAQDGDGELSPFTAAFVSEVVKPGLDVRLMIARVREKVFAATHGEQKPYSDDGLIGEVYLAGR